MGLLGVQGLAGTATGHFVLYVHSDRAQISWCVAAVYVLLGARLHAKLAAAAGALDRAVDVLS